MKTFARINLRVHLKLFDTISVDLRSTEDEIILSQILSKKLKTLDYQI